MCFVDEWPVIELGSGEDPDHVIPTTEWLCLRLSRLSLSLSLSKITLRQLFPSLLVR